MKQSRKSLCWPGMEANFHYKHSLNENNHLEFFFITRTIAQDKVIVMLFRALLTEYNAGHSKSRKQPIRNTRKRAFCPFVSAMRVDRFRLACGHGWRTAFRCDTFAKPLTGISLASRVGRAIDGRKSLRKSASDQLRRSCFRVNKQNPTLYTLMYTPNIKISMLDVG